MFWYCSEIFCIYVKIENIKVWSNTNGENVFHKNRKWSQTKRRVIEGNNKDDIKYAAVVNKMQFDLLG